MIQTVYFIGTLSALDRLPKGDLRFVVLEEDDRLEPVLRELRRRAAPEIPREDILSLVPGEATDEFIQGMVRLGDPGHLLWWANPVSRRLAIRDTLFESIYAVLGLDDYCRRADHPHLIVVTSRREWARQMSVLTGVGYRVCDLTEGAGRLRDILRSFPFVLARSALRLVVNKIWCSVLLPSGHARKVSPVIMMSNFNKHSLAKSAVRFEDIYWGKFSEQIIQGKIPATVVLEVDVSMRKFIRLLRQSAGGAYFPKEAFLSWLDLVRILCKSAGIFFTKPRVSLSIKGRSFDLLLKHFWRKSIRSRTVFDCVAMYYAMARIGRLVQPRQFLFLFENKSIERAAIMALRKYSSKTRIVGYQHAAVKPKDIHLGAAEAESALWPDQILTTGPIASGYMQRLFGWDREKLKEACALRGISHNGVLKPRPPACRQLLVILSTDINEYCAMLRFLDRASGDLAGYDVILRPHPDISLEKAMTLTGTLKFSFRVDTVKKSLVEALDDADALVYSSSTVAIEALLHGVPLIHLRYAGILDSDTLHDFCTFKWEAARPQDIKGSIEQIWSIPPEEFLRRQNEAAGYARDYLRPVDDRTLNIFTE